MAEQMLMKDGLEAAAVERIAVGFSRVMKDFPAKDFKQAAMDGLKALELKERVNYLIAVLHNYLPQDFKRTAKILLRLKANWERGDDGDPLRGFAAWPVIDYVGVHGLEHPELALDVLKNLTQMFSAEFAIRPFLIQHTKLALAKMQRWCGDESHHVRRLVSEGSRPRLPWGQHLPLFVKDPAPVIKLLEKLKDDPSEYVRRSVANNLNDISKDHPDLVIKLCTKWQKNASPERLKIIRHATRTLVKAGHAEVFGLLGYTNNPQVKIQAFTLANKQLSLGGSLTFKAILVSESSKSQKMVLDYVVHHVKANGLTAPKVFKLKNLELAAGEKLVIEKKHALKKITTRKYYSGKHSVELLINGKPLAQKVFELVVD